MKIQPTNSVHPADAAWPNHPLVFRRRKTHKQWIAGDNMIDQAGQYPARERPRAHGLAKCIRRRPSTRKS